MTCRFEIGQVETLQRRHDDPCMSLQPDPALPQVPLHPLSILQHPAQLHLYHPRYIVIETNVLPERSVHVFVLGVDDRTARSRHGEVLGEAPHEVSPGRVRPLFTVRQAAREGVLSEHAEEVYLVYHHV